ncbi:tyrosine-type recombinase/integrase [Staphylococcus aureus]
MPILRHTHATELIRSEWDAAYVQKRLGHAHVQTTLIRMFIFLMKISEE